MDFSARAISLALGEDDPIDSRCDVKTRVPSGRWWKLKLVT